MLVDVVHLRQAGRRLKGRELGAPVRGELVVRPIQRGSTAERGDSLCAYLTPVAGDSLAGRRVLADVRIIQFDGGLLRLTGTEIVSEPSPDHLTDHEAERMQVWRCRLVLPSDCTGHFDVVLLRSRGRRLGARERPPAVTGELIVRGGEGMQTSYFRDGLAANLRRAQGANTVMVGALTPLFDVRLIQVDAALTIAGVELSVVRDDRQGAWLTTESVQVWRCSLARPSSSATSPDAAAATGKVDRGDPKHPHVPVDGPPRAALGVNDR